MILSMDAEKRSDKVQHPFMIKRFLEGTNLNIIKTIYEKPTANITLTGENCFSPKVKNKTNFYSILY